MVIVVSGLVRVRSWDWRRKSNFHIIEKGSKGINIILGWQTDNIAFYFTETTSSTKI